MTVAICLKTFVRGDAVGNDAQGMLNRLTARNIPSVLFTQENHTSTPSLPIAELPAFARQRDVSVIYHHSIGWPSGVRALQALARGNIAIKHHNITPPQYFAGLSKAARCACQQGLAEVPTLARLADVIWADSAFNVQQFAPHLPGASLRVLPPFHQAEMLQATVPEYSALDGADDWRSTLLMVGRFVPNKNLHFALEVLSNLCQHFDPEARLVLAGDDSWPGYRTALDAKISSMHLERNVCITGKISLGALHGLYLTADVLLQTSLHEGFCVPLVEAMLARVSIAALPTSAIPETGGDAMVSLPTDAMCAAAVVAELLSNRAYLEDLRHRGWQRYQAKFSTAAVTAQFDSLVDELRAKAPSRRGLSVAG
jgi:glycosyltransferase involved in cell wall biosynthesis